MNIVVWELLGINFIKKSGIVLKDFQNFCLKKLSEFFIFKSVYTI
jgi:hypothetical protein